MMHALAGCPIASKSLASVFKPCKFLAGQSLQGAGPLQKLLAAVADPEHELIPVMQCRQVPGSRMRGLQQGHELVVGLASFLVQSMPLLQRFLQGVGLPFLQQLRQPVELFPDGPILPRRLFYEFFHVRVNPVA